MKKMTEINLNKHAADFSNMQIENMINWKQKPTDQNKRWATDKPMLKNKYKQTSI